MHLGRFSRALGLAAAVAVALGACTVTEDQTAPVPSPTVAEGARGGSATVAEVNALSTFNPNTADGNTDVNVKISYATHSGFFYLDNKLSVVRNEKFGTMEKVSDNPLTVKYSIKEGVKWSDDTPVTAADLLLQWAAFSGYYDDAAPDGATGTSYFSYAGDPTGLALTDFPELGADGRSLTLKYARPYTDWETVLGGPGVDIPAHVLARKAGLAGTKEFVELLRSIPRGDAVNPQPANAQLTVMAGLWNTGFDSTSLPADVSLYLSNGPYIVRSVNENQTLTMIRNRDYNWGPEAKLDEITVRYIGDAGAQVQALQAGQADIIAPQASNDTVDQLKALESEGVTVEVGRQLAYDHIDLNYSGPFAEKSVREAFLKTVPRREIVNRILKGLDPDPAPLDSQLFIPGQAPYSESARSNGSSEYQEVDITAARKLLDGATPEVRIMYNKDNPNRVTTFTLIRESAGKAGFQVVDGGLGGSDWGKALGKGGYDAAIFGWSNSGDGGSGVPQVFKSGNDSNFNGFSDPGADELMDELIVTTDPSEQDSLAQQIDRKVWESAYGLPLFQLVGVDAYSKRITGVKYMPNQTGVWWNFWEWSQKLS
ncbi:ABC transporter family substrate-binding protein [Arthrobacter sp. PAMC25284]|uniref:ABC transporter family substrate-binding protein n=1 Tax=Arthrobacter sp. PAMC25284 TaxID=2861279 RepID=UPI001C637CB5|nr:ABC transporter family substrate-binding protein [Arthrobacter sp. PAMC25284]QYF89601.1 ABC transporter family substrate-binding protein [Arthrobacter sp. PAMC25284]